LPPGQVLPVDVGRLQIDLSEVACEMAVPEEGHALRERGRRAQHPIEPPADELLRLDRLLLRRVIRAGEGRRLGCFRFDETVDGLLEAVLYRLSVQDGRRAARGPALEMPDLGFAAVELPDPVHSGRRRGLCWAAEARQFAQGV